jgi:hypothetical protein
VKPVRFRWLALIPIFLLTAACPLFNLWSESPQPVNKVTPAVEPCIALTGEDLHPLEIIRRLPETARPGDTLTFAFAGSYMVMPSCEKRDGKAYYHYPTMQELSEKTWRDVVAQLDGKDLTSVRCGHECQLEFSLPTETKIGKHTITILTGGSPFFNPKDTTFTIAVIEP